MHSHSNVLKNKVLLYEYKVEMIKITLRKKRVVTINFSCHPDGTIQYVDSKIRKDALAYRQWKDVFCLIDHRFMATACNLHKSQNQLPQPLLHFFATPIGNEWE